LKQQVMSRMEGSVRSRPARARGLKPHALRTVLRHEPVAPRAGAWIETP